MSVRRFALIDPAAGISGDMLLGALIDAGAKPAWLEDLPARLGLADVRVELADVMRCGLRATKVTVVGPGGATEGPADVFHADPTSHGSGHPHHHDGHHHHHHHPHPDHFHHHGAGDHPHRHVADLLAVIAGADLSDQVKTVASRVFRLLGAAEARVHGVPEESVALHEVGGADAMIDIVGAAVCLERLGVEAVYGRPVAVGQGWIRAAHGNLPVPAPATALLLEGVPIAPNGPVTGEATTPTGAALLRGLVSGPMPEAEWRSIAVGFGAGGRSPEAYANTLRVTLGEFAAAPAETVVALVSDLDDFEPEYLEPLREALTAAGALDVQCWTTAAKKGRIGLRVEALAPVERVSRVEEAFFRHSNTTGVRRVRFERTVLPRESWSFTTASGETVRMKTRWTPDGPRVKPEYDDVVAVARRTGQSAHTLFRSIQDEAQRALRSDRPEPAGAAIAHSKESIR